MQSLLDQRSWMSQILYRQYSGLLKERYCNFSKVYTLDVQKETSLWIQTKN